MSGPPPGDMDRIERALGWRPTWFRPATELRGASDTAARWIVGDAGRSAFVKIGATELTAGWTRDEHRNYLAIGGPFMPRVLGFDDDGERPALALEDLSGAEWPPPWTDDRVRAVLDALAAVYRTPPPDDLPRRGDLGANWPAVAADPRPFLALGLCSAGWLDASLPTLIEASGAAEITGDSLIHNDVRSDNLCFRDGGAVLIDWNHASIANPDLDIAFWLPSLHAEGGPTPERIMPSAAALAAYVAGFFSSRAGDPDIPEAPHVRPLQIAQSRTALPWAARALGLPEPR
ncbi:MAG: hypothetical protein QOI92_2192 [Chloroflexota bacterium]|nr:hypothetical protein [Chloroflexota bacterium]